MTFTLAPAHLRALAGALTILLVMAGTGDVRADDAQKSASKSLLAKDLTGVPNKEALMFTVEYPPGGASKPHRHDAHVFVYVLEGSLRTGVDGQEPVTLKPGDTFYESPTDIHRVSANASKTEPVKFLVVMVKDKDKPVTSMLDAKNDN